MENMMISVAVNYKECTVNMFWECFYLIGLREMYSHVYLENIICNLGIGYKYTGYE